MEAAGSAAFTSITVTPPTGFEVRSSFGSPSLAATIAEPSGVKATMSGIAPAGKVAIRPRVAASNSAMKPAACASAFSMAAAISPPLAATELTPP